MHQKFYRFKRVKICNKVQPKSVFKNLSIFSPGDQWRNDRHLLGTSNPVYEEIEKQL